MVLIRIAIAALVLGGCHQSLFDSHGDDDTHGDGNSGGDGTIASSCPSPCLGDAGGDFDGTPAGSTGHWRYLDDQRARSWAAMTVMGKAFVGMNPANIIASCRDDGGAEACGALPGALLVSTAGSTAAADPAIEYKVPTPSRVIQIQLGVHVPSGAGSQTVRLYRNSREDVLFTAIADAGATVSQTLTIDAISGDRILVAIAPVAGGATKVGVQLFFVGDAATFPSTCQLVLPLDTATGTMVDNLCGAKLTSEDFDTSMTITPTLTAAPFPEQGMSAALTTSHYYSSVAALDRSGDFTVQMWLRHKMLFDSVTGGWPFSDMDLDNTGGVGLVIYDPGSGTLALDVSTCTQVTPSLAFDAATITYPMDMMWHFVRVTHKLNGVLAVCLDGVKQVQKTMAGSMKSTYGPYIGKNVVWTPSEPNYIGDIDDVRVYTTALPCE